jgi:stalled ribosome alternative rescue factor ArfA
MQPIQHCKQHTLLRLGIFQQKVVKAKKGTGSFSRKQKNKKGNYESE